MEKNFDWDVAKAQSNLSKHRVSFEIATRMFADPFAMVEQDRIENGERRWQTLGLVDGHLLLLVAPYRPGGRGRRGGRRGHPHHLGATRRREGEKTL